jgi:hypothetical protein
MKFFKILASLFVFFLINSCSEDYKIVDSINGVIVTADNSFTLINNEVTFSSFTTTGENITSESDFFVNGKLLNSNTFTSSTIGEFYVTSKHSGVSSEQITVTFHDGTQVNFRKRLLIEDYTGTWCGYCTRVSYAIEQVKNITNDVVTVAINRDSSNPTSGTYDPYNYDTSALESLFTLSGYPKGLLNRMTVWISPQDTNIAQATALTQGENPKLGLAMDNTIVGNTINLEVNVKFSKDFSNLKLVVYVLENGLVYPQKNYTTYYGAVNPLTDYVHNHTLRSCETNLFGDPINNNETTSGDTYSRTFNIPIPSNVSNANNIEFVAFVVDENGNAINARKVSKNENQTFEEL